MFAYIYSKVRNQDGTEEILQEMWLRAFKSLKEREGESFQLPGWLYGIAKNCCHEYMRERSRFASATRNIETTEPNNQSKEKMISVVLEAIQDLPEEPRIIMTMKYVNQMSCPQIAQALNKPVGTVKSTLCRAYDTLRGIVSTRLKEIEL